MKSSDISFVVLGLISGLLCISFGLGPPQVAIVGLTYAEGPLLFAAIVLGLLITGALPNFRPGFWRYVGGFVICTISYLAALVTFFAVFGFAPYWFGIRSSQNVVDFGVDVWIGLIAAGVIGAVGIALFTALLERQWNNALLAQLLAAAFCTITITFIANLPFHNSWSFIGVLLPLGNALFCFVVGRHIILEKVHAKRTGQ